MCWLIFMLSMRPEVGRQSLGFLDPTLNVKIERGMHTYADDCALTFTRFWADIDHYYLCHWLDWFVASLLFRDAYIVHFWSLFYEVIELSAKHRLPHFAECWWDSLLTDVLFSNTPAIFLGLWVIDYFGLRRFDWLGRYGKTSIADWDVFHCHRRWGNNCLMLVLFSLHFLCSFFIMNAFLVPPTHPAVACRMLLWAGIGGLGFREAYIDLETWNTPVRKQKAVEGRYRWLAAGIIITEALISYKYREGTGHITDTPTPWYIWMPWTSGALGLLFVFLYLRFKPDHSLKYPGFGQPEVAEEVAEAVVQPGLESPRRGRRASSPNKKSLSLLKKEQ